MIKFSDISVKRKITLIILIITISSLGIGSSFVITTSISSFRDAIKERMLTSAEIIADYVVTDIEFGDFDAANNSLSKFKKYKIIKNVVIFTKDGKRFAEFKRDKNVNGDPNREIQQVFNFFNKSKKIDLQYFADKSNELHTFKGIEHESGIIGIVFIRSSTDELYSRIFNYIYFTIILVSLIMFVAIFIGLRLQKAVTTPILNLAAVAEDISKNENFSVRVKKVNNDEVGKLYDSFNNMLEQIVSRQSERDSAIASLSVSEKNFRNIFNSSHDAVFIHDLNGKIIDVNNTMLAMYGVSREEAIHFSIEDYSSKENPIKDLPSILKDVSIGDEREFFWIANRPHENYKFYVQVNLKKLELAGFEVIMATVRDITEEKKAKDALIESENKLQTMFDVLPVGIGIINNGIYLDVNDKTCEILKYSRNKLIGNDSSILYKNRDDYQKSMELLFNDNDEYSRDKYTELNWVRGDGKEITVLFGTMPLNKTAKNGECLFSFFEITELKNAEKEILKLNAELENRVIERTQQLESANRELEAFSYSVSHDLRAPLRSIDGFSLALLEDYSDKIDDEGKTFILRVRNAAQRMSQLIDDMLKLSKTTRGTLKIEKFRIDELVNSIINTIKDSNPGIETDFIVNAHIEINADPNLLGVALENLIRNAFKFSIKKTKPIVCFGFYPEDIAFEKFKINKIVFYINDNGAGFDMQYVNKLFGAFQRLHDESDFEGTGIGLATVKRIISRHNGAIWAEGEVDKGATFYFTLN